MVLKMATSAYRVTFSENEVLPQEKIKLFPKHTTRFMLSLFYLNMLDTLISTKTRLNQYLFNKFCQYAVKKEITSSKQTKIYVVKSYVTANVLISNHYLTI